MPKIPSFPIGIDIGNENSIIGKFNRKRQVEIVPNEHSRRSTPTLVSFHKQRRYFGVDASDQQMENQNNTTNSIKRLIGIFFNSHEDIKNESMFISPQLVQSENEFIGFNINYLNANYHFNMLQLLSMFLKYLKTVSETSINGTKLSNNDSVTLSCPGWYNDRQRRLVSDAGKLAGFKKVHLLSEMNAIALTYVIYKQDELPKRTEPNRIVSFIDIGESTTSMAIMSVNKNEIKTFDKSFNKNVGGRNFDLMILNKLIEICWAEYRLNIVQNSSAWFKLLTLSKKIKASLSYNPIVQIQLENLQNNVDVLFTVKQSDFEECCIEVFKEIEEQIRETLKRYSNITSSSIHSVELVGGSSRIPMLRSRIERIFKNQIINTSIPADESIAIGTAYYTTLKQNIPLQMPIVDIRDINLNDIEFIYTNNTGVLEKVTPFQRNDFIPNTKVITLDKDHDFMIQANYKQLISGSKSSASRNSYGYLSNGSSKFIGQWNIKDIIESLQKQTSNDMASIISTASTSVSVPQTRIRLVLKRDIDELVTIEEVSIIKEVERIGRKSSISNFFRKIERKQTMEFRELTKLSVASDYQTYTQAQLECFQMLEEKLSKQDELIINKEESKNKFEQTFLKLKSSMDYIDELHDGPDKNYIFNYLNKTNDWLGYDDYDDNDYNFDNFENFNNIYEVKYKELCQIVNRYDIVL